MSFSTHGEIDTIMMPSTIAISKTARVTHGAAAAAQERAILEAALGGPEAVEKAIGRGRPNLSGGRGKSPRRQVRLPLDLDTELTKRADHEHRSPAEVIRDPVAAYLRTS